MRPDLHLHSEFSLDGEYSPEDLARICCRHGVTWASLTDHNCVRGTRRFMEAARLEGVRAIAGTELDCICTVSYTHLEQSYEKLDRKRTELRFIENSCRQPEKCRVCQWYSLCRNGCRRDRVTDLNGQPGINSYCEGYQAFFEAVYPRLARLAEGGGKE